MFDCSTCSYDACALAHVLPTTVMLLLEEVKGMPGYLTLNLEQTSNALPMSVPVLFLKCNDRISH